MLATNLGFIINLIILTVYFIIAKDTHAWPSKIIIWAWSPLVAYLGLYHYFDGVQNATRNIARIYLLQRDGLNYSKEDLKLIWDALIPNVYRPLELLWHLCDVTSFACLLLLQGWATVLVAHAIIIFFGWLIPINYHRHLKIIRSAFPVTLSVEQRHALLWHGFGRNELRELRTLLRQAIKEHRNPQRWWGEVWNEAQRANNDES